MHVIGTRIGPWEYDRKMYKRCNEIERLFRRLKGFRRIFSRFEKLDVMFLGFIVFVLPPPNWVISVSADAVLSVSPAKLRGTVSACSFKVRVKQVRAKNYAGSQ